MRKKLVLFTTLLTITLTGCSSTPANDNSAELESLKAQVESLQKENDALKSQSETTTEPETTEELSASLLTFDEEGILDDWSITVTAIEITDLIKQNDYFGFNPEDGNKYLTVDLTIVNNGKNASSFLPSFSMSDDISAKVLYQGDYEFSATNLLGYDKELHDTTINPLSTKSGIIAFEIPDSVASSDEELILIISAGNKNLQFKIR